MATRPRNNPLAVAALEETAAEAGAANKDGQLIGDALELADEIALQELANSAGEGATQDDTRCTVMRVDESVKPARNVRLFEVSLAEYLAQGGFDFLAREYGSGCYKLNVWHKQTGQLLTRRQVHVEAPKSAALSKAAPAAQSGQFGPEAFIALMQQSNTQMMNAFTSLAGALAGRPAAAPAESFGAKDLISVMAAVDNLKGDRKSGGMKEMLETLSIAKTLTGGGGETSENDVLIALLSQLGSPLAEALKNRAKPAAPVVLKPNAIAAPIAAAKPAAEAANNGDTEMSAQLKMFLGLCVSNAARGNSPETYASMLLDHVAPELVIGFLKSATWKEELARLEPGVMQYPNWFNEMRDCVVRELYENPESAKLCADAGIAQPPEAAAA